MDKECRKSDAGKLLTWRREAGCLIDILMEVCEMQGAEVILSILDEKSSKDRNFLFKRLFRILFNTELYDCLSSDLKNTLENKDLVSISENLKKERLKDIFSCNEHAKVVCELTTKILDALYEPLCRSKYYEEDVKFKNVNNRFLFMKKNFSKIKYFLEVFIEDVDLKVIEQQIDKILAIKIDDGRFISLVKKNIEYFCERDERQAFLLKKVLNHALLHYICQKIIDKNNFKEEFSYCIYNESLIFGIRLRREKVLELKEIFKRELNLLFKNTKTRVGVELKDIQSKKLMFAGFEITKSKDDKIFYLMPLEAVNEVLNPFLKDGKPVHFNSWINLSVNRIIANYKGKINHIESYYMGTDNFAKRMKRLKFYLQLSLLKTIARKEKISIKKVLQRYGKNLLDRA